MWANSSSYAYIQYWASDMFSIPGFRLYIGGGCRPRGTLSITEAFLSGSENRGLDRGSIGTETGPSEEEEEEEVMDHQHFSWVQMTNTQRCEQSLSAASTLYRPADTWTGGACRKTGEAHYKGMQLQVKELELEYQATKSRIKNSLLLAFALVQRIICEILSCCINRTGRRRSRVTERGGLTQQTLAHLRTPSINILLEAMIHKWYISTLHQSAYRMHVESLQSAHVLLHMLW